MRSLTMLVLLLLTACATAGTGGESNGSSRDLITRAEIEESGASNAYQLVQSERPQWLRLRGSGKDPVPVRVVTRGGAGPGQDGVGVGVAPGGASVYLNNARMGTTEALAQIQLGSVQYVQFFSPAAANLRWGAGNANGAILVSTEPAQ